ncbi:DJ-1/PfpI family protein [Halolamina salifodinae]|uniref:Transcriptional regulator GlxA family with amidase domain n=1 Tax=Halolamina salifodinae TaxID=1202767 RepID=A0A8T4GW79_9EURY|nr:DJ-1/PfpI family protein [Halolamina salifodinae]MBP1985595.1 transcriptional regulator GlxA family with amidase domain [Halolamina salifodinae]
MTTRIDVLLYDGFDELDAVGPFEVFQNAAAAGADCEVSLVTATPQERVVASHGLDVGVTGRSPVARGASLNDVDGTLADPEDADAPDLLVVPGGGWSAGEGEDSPARTGVEGGVRREYEAGDLPPVIAAHYEAGATIASVCTGAMLLEQAGLLGDGPAITHQSAVEDLRNAGVEVPDARVVDTGEIVTAGGVTSGIDLALYLTERAFGADIAESVATTLEYERTGDVLVAR